MEKLSILTSSIDAILQIPKSVQSVLKQSLPSSCNSSLICHQSTPSSPNNSSSLCNNSSIKQNSSSSSRNSSPILQKSCSVTQKSSPSSSNKSSISIPSISKPSHPHSTSQKPSQTTNIYITKPIVINQYFNYCTHQNSSNHSHPNPSKHKESSIPNNHKSKSEVNKHKEIQSSSKSSIRSELVKPETKSNSTDLAKDTRTVSTNKEKVKLEFEEKKLRFCDFRTVIEPNGDSYKEKAEELEGFEDLRDENRRRIRWAQDKIMLNEGNVLGDRWKNIYYTDYNRDEERFLECIKERIKKDDIFTFSNMWKRSLFVLEKNSIKRCHKKFIPITKQAQNQEKQSNLQRNVKLPKYTEENKETKLNMNERKEIKESVNIKNNSMGVSGNAHINENKKRNNKLKMKELIENTCNLN